MKLAGTTADASIAVAVVSGLAGLAGVYLDTAWHRTVGRDSFFILPHLFIYDGGLGVWAAALAAIARASLGREAEFGGPVLRLGRLRFPVGFHLGAGVAALGLLFAVAAQRGRGALAHPWLWWCAMLAMLVDLVHRGHFVLAHYTMLPHSRTPDFYPFLVALLAPVVLVAAARAVGPWAPTLACLAFLAVAWLVDVMLRVIEFERYALTPILVAPSAVLSCPFVDT